MAAFLHVNNCICENISCQMKHSLFWRFWCHFWANKLNWLFYWHNTYKEFVPVPVCPGTGSDRFQETRLSGSVPTESPTQKVFRPKSLPAYQGPRTYFRLDCKRNTWLWMFLDFISAIFDMLCIAVWNPKHWIQLKNDLRGLQTPLAELSPTKKLRRPFAHWRRCQRYSSPTLAEIWIITNITDWGKNHKIPSYL